MSNFIKILPLGEPSACMWTDRHRQKAGERERQTDRHDEANSRFSKFCKRA